MNWKEQNWLLRKRRYEQLSNWGWDFFHTALIIKFPFLFFFVLGFVLFCFVFLEKGVGEEQEIKSEKNAKKHFPQYLKTENHSLVKTV